MARVLAHRKSAKQKTSKITRPAKKAKPKAAFKMAHGNASSKGKVSSPKAKRNDKKDFFDQYGPEAKVILNELLDKYADYGTAQFVIPDILRVPPISQHGNVIEIAAFFGGAEKLKEAVNQLQTLLYAA